MTTSIIQRSLAGGEISPAVYARTDLVKYQTGLKKCRNFIVLRHGGVSNRSGTEFCGEVKSSTKVTRIFRFRFNTSNTYALEFGDLYMRVYVRGIILTVSGLAAYAGGTTYGVADLVSYAGGNYYSIQAGNIGHQPDISPTFWYAMPINGTYEIPSPFSETELFELNRAQSADIMTWVHPNHDPVELRREGHTKWSFVTVSFSPATARPTGMSYTATTAGASILLHKVVAVNKDTLEQSLPALSTTTRVITAITQANPAVVTSAGHGYANDNEEFIQGVVGMTELNGRTFAIDNVTANTFELVGIDSTGYGAYVSGGTSNQTHLRATAVTFPVTLGWNYVTGALEYDVFRYSNGRYGYIGTTKVNSFVDSGIAVNLTDTPPNERLPFFGVDNKPFKVTYAQQRLVFGGTNNDPEKVFMSRSASFHNYTFRSPQQDDDAITFPVVGKEVSRIQNMFEIGRFVVMTEAGEFTIDGNDAGIILPSAINPHQQGYNGASAIPEILIGNSALYVQARGGIVRDFKFEIQSNGYTGKDLTVFAAHMFDNNSLVSWDYQQTPHSIVWAARNDGKLLGLTYLREHDVWGWHQHDTIKGLFEDVASVPEDGSYGNEDFMYFIVRRTIGGVQKRYVERMKSRKFKKENVVDDSWFVDCGLEYDGRNYGATTMKLQGPNWTVDDVITLESSVAVFSALEVGNQIVLFYTTYADNDTYLEFPIQNEVRGEIIAYTDPTHVSVRVSADVPVVLRNVATVSWARAVDELSGLGHLIGETVAVFGEGYTVANGVDDDPPLIVDALGKIVLSEPYYLIRAGLPIRSQLQTLDIDVVDGETLRDKQKMTGKVSILYQDSRGTFVGSDADHLEELRQRDQDDDWGPIQPFTGTEEIDIEHTWEGTGSVFVEQRDPLPITILAIIPAVTIGG